MVSYGKVSRNHTYSEEDQTKTIREIGPRFFHCMTTVLDNSFYQAKARPGTKYSYHGMWISDRGDAQNQSITVDDQKRSHPEGMYIFGGIDSEGCRGRVKAILLQISAATYRHSSGKF